jgi:hypothetical protein
MTLPVDYSDKRYFQLVDWLANEHKVLSQALRREPTDEEHGSSSRTAALSSGASKAAPRAMESINKGTPRRRRSRRRRHSSPMQSFAVAWSFRITRSRCSIRKIRSSSKASCRSSSSPARTRSSSCHTCQRRVVEQDLKAWRRVAADDRAIA